MRALSVLVIAACILSGPRAEAYFQMELMKAKRAKKESTRWTLADWLAQKRRVALMDHWLAMNTSASWFELNLGGAYGRFDRNTPVSHQSEAYEVDVYLTLLNLRGEYELTEDRREAYGGSAGLRLLGTSSQTTGLVARYGWRKLNHLEERERWEQQYAEGVLQLYVARFFGLQGKYRHYLPSRSNKSSELRSTRWTAGGFLEWSIFRVYGDYYSEPSRFEDLDGSAREESRSGFEAGLKLFF